MWSEIQYQLWILDASNAFLDKKTRVLTLWPAPARSQLCVGLILKTKTSYLEFSHSDSSTGRHGTNCIMCSDVGPTQKSGMFHLVMHYCSHTRLRQKKTKKKQKHRTAKTLLLIKSLQTLSATSQRTSSHKHTHTHTHTHTHSSWFNQCGCTVEALSPFGARRYCGDDCSGILMSSLYCVGLRWRESVDYLVTSPPFLSPHLAPPQLTTPMCMCVCVCVFVCLV